MQRLRLWLMDRYPVQADPRPQTANREVLLGAGLRTGGGQARTHARILTLGPLVAGLTCRLEATVVAAARALTGAEAEGSHQQEKHPEKKS